MTKMLLYYEAECKFRDYCHKHKIEFNKKVSLYIHQIFFEKKMWTEEELNNAKKEVENFVFKFKKNDVLTNFIQKILMLKNTLDEKSNVNIGQSEVLESLRNNWPFTKSSEADLEDPQGNKYDLKHTKDKNGSAGIVCQCFVDEIPFIKDNGRVIFDGKKLTDDEWKEMRANITRIELPKGIFIRFTNYNTTTHRYTWDDILSDDLEVMLNNRLTELRKTGDNKKIMKFTNKINLRWSRWQHGQYKCSWNHFINRTFC